jgi:hypothetical protein
MSITNPAVCKVVLVIQFFNTKKIGSAEIHCQLAEMCGEGVMNEGGNVRKWCRVFSGEKRAVHNGARFRRLSEITEDLKGMVHAHVRVHRRFTLDELYLVSRMFLYRVPYCYSSTPVEKTFLPDTYIHTSIYIYIYIDTFLTSNICS